MAAWFMVAMAVAGQTTTTDSQSVSAPAEVREIAAIRREVSELLKTESATKAEAERGRQVRRMSEVYLEVVGDERTIINPVLQQQKAKLHTRLIRVRDELKRRRSSEGRGRDEPDRDKRGRESDQDREQRELAGSLAAHLQLASQTLGGSAAVLEGAAGGGPIDFADDLIDLITETINPSHWSANGGPGSIVFFRPCLALVVRATGEVHGRVGDVIGALRE